MAELRSLWFCEDCNAFHVGGVDLISDGDDSMVAKCGARWTPEGGTQPLWETHMVVEDDYPEMTADWRWKPEEDLSADEYQAVKEQLERSAA